MSDWILVGENYREGIARTLEARAEEIGSGPGMPTSTRARVVRDAPKIRLPELHTFVDARGFEFAVIGWNQDDCLEYLRADRRATFPVEWASSSTAWPGLYVVNLGPRPGSGQEWHIDHIRPLASFDLDDSEQVRQAFAPENHQWLPAKDNLSKGAKYEV